ncbi:BTAD domain-containing putative transcriptional regulator [Mycolicibacterium xanthum]|uniref:BTAD domain-containing putative transcriptional regulator n=1 Tax=Mycolicibacterium xanthum TaxID=2796469 RepID=UPI0027E0CB77|nr:AAA family ATPase [Mycolicibacterium xanthum]
MPDPSGLERERLEKPLLCDAPTTLGMVIAPAGSGKSTLLARVAAATEGPVGWYRVTSDDSSEARLVAHIAEALAELLESGRPPAGMAELLAALESWNGPGGLLVLDDLHEIADSPAEKALEDFIWLRPRRLRVLCGSRRSPEINVPRMRVSGALREIGPDELRFRTWEVEELFASVYDEPLRPEAAAALTRRTGGWAAGLQLFRLATSGHTTRERHQAVSDLAGRSKLVRAYLARNVLADLPADRRRFLLRTCALGRLSGEACDALLGATGSHQVLEELEAAQLFTSTDDGGVYFRYHAVLQSHLELALVEECGQAEADAWYRRSAEVLESLGEIQAAARAFAKAGDWGSVSRLVRDVSEARLDVSAVDDPDLLPASTWQHDPWLALAHARRLVREGALSRAAETYGRAQRLYDDPGYQQICLDEAHAVAMWSPGHRWTEPGQPEGGGHWSGYLREALRQAPEFAEAGCPPVSARARLSRGLAALAAGELRQARELLTVIGREESADQLAAICAGAACAALELIDGACSQTASRLGTLAAIAESEGLPWVSRMCHGLEHISLLLSQDADWLLDGGSALVRSAERAGDGWGAGLLGFALGMAKQRIGHDGSDDFAAAGEQFRVLDAPVLELWCRLAAMTSASAPGALREAVVTSRRLGCRGAEARAMGLLSASVPEDHPQADAAEVAGQCGIPLSAVRAERPAARGGPAVDITCFGGYRMRIGGADAPVDRLRPKARAVLQILSLAPGQDHHRESLEDILWPGVDHAVAGHRLQVAVSSARGLLDTAATIERRGESYRLSSPGAVAVDVRDFETALAQADRLSARGDIAGRMAARRCALGLYVADLLPELAGVEYFDIERDRLRHLAAAAAAALAADHRDRGDYEQALAGARRSVQLDPYQDCPWSTLAEVHEKLGDTGSAEYVRREHSRRQAELRLPVL